MLDCRNINYGKPECGYFCLECTALCTLKNTFVDFEKEQAVTDTKDYFVFFVPPQVSILFQWLSKVDKLSPFLYNFYLWYIIFAEYASNICRWVLNKQQSIFYISLEMNLQSIVRLIV